MTATHDLRVNWKNVPTRTTIGFAASRRVITFDNLLKSCGWVLGTIFGVNRTICESDGTRRDKTSVVTHGHNVRKLPSASVLPYGD